MVYSWDKYVVSNLLGGLEVIHQNMWSFEMIIILQLSIGRISSVAVEAEVCKT